MIDSGNHAGTITKVDISQFEQPTIKLPTLALYVNYLRFFVEPPWYLIRNFYAYANNPALVQT